MLARDLLAEQPLLQALLFGLEEGLGIDAAEQVEEDSDETRPPGLVAGPKSRAIVAVEVLVKEDEIAPVRIVLEFFRSSVDRASPLGIPQEDAGETTRDLLGHFKQRHLPAGARGTLHLELVAVESIEVEQRADDEDVDRHPHRASPIRVPAEHAGVRLGGQVLDHVLLRSDPEPERMFQVMA